MSAPQPPMDTVGANHNSNQGTSPFAPNPKNPACDHCREKKIRCSREKPTCHHCRSSKSVCVYSEPQKRPPDVSRNAHRFEEVFSRLDRIESAIANLTRLIQQQRNSDGSYGKGTPESTESLGMVEEIPSAAQKTPATTTTVFSNSSTAPLLTAASAPQKQFVKDAEGTEQYLGSSSILSITAEAQRLAEEGLISANMMPRRLLDSNSGASGTSGEGGLDDLSTSANTFASAVPFYGHKLIREGAAQVKKHIPWKAEALGVVDDFFKTVYHWFPILDEETFRKDLDQMYAEPETMINDNAWMVLFNNILLFGLYGKGMNTSAEERNIIDARNSQRTQTWFYNAWAALDDLEIALTPRLRNVQALFTMSLCAIELSRPALTWGLLSQAARSAQALGLHRRGKPQPGISRSQIEERKNLFWCIYMLDKQMSLLFGRAACLPEFDCDVELPIDDGTNAYYKNFMAQIAMARVQSAIYVRLYSAQAATQSQRDLEVAVLELDREVDAWWEEWGEMTDYEKKGGPFRAVDYFEHVHLKFTYYSAVTLINRMARLGMGLYVASEQKALESARAAIRLVMQAVTNSPDLGNTGLLLWLFNCYPFTSFFVLFSNIIRHPDAPSSTDIDLKLMQQLVEYFGRMQERNHESAARLRSVATAFTNVAITFLRNYRRQMRGIEAPSNTNTMGSRKRPRYGHDDDEDPLPPLYPPVNHTLRTDPAGWCPPISLAPPPPPPTFPQTAQEVEVDVATASFLRWPSASPPAFGASLGGVLRSSSSRSGDADPGGGCSNGGEVDGMDIEALMAEPLGFQMRMEQAAQRGPIEFDWFGWEAHLGADTPAQGGG
ncbi:fungal-specific transcription factor domain-containing protein [Sphaerosporella brunnea]|uniref:Fungal-specific transcription factor domain-containing protein n=1 Tax=Sphaerosporella brunnea TaxID=1250544 RepID=A0A5J5EGS9_9PEZI|nr:fungal-specific transcription factor domain-containing protein [Sphaerosporella brunnea]